MSHNHLTELLYQKTELDRKLAALRFLQIPKIKAMPECANFRAEFQHTQENMLKFFLMDQNGVIPMASAEDLRKLSEDCEKLRASADALSRKITDAEYKKLFDLNDPQQTLAAFLEQVKTIAENDSRLLKSLPLDGPADLGDAIGKEEEKAEESAEKPSENEEAQEEPAEEEVPQSRAEKTAATGTYIRQFMQEKIAETFEADMHKHSLTIPKDLKRELSALQKTVSYVRDMLQYTPVLRTGIYLSYYRQQLMRVHDVTETFLTEITKDNSADHSDLINICTTLSQDIISEAEDITAGIKRQGAETPAFNLVTMEQVRSGKQQAEEKLRTDPDDIQAAAAWLVYNELSRIGDDGIRMMGYSRRHLSEDIQSMADPTRIREYTRHMHTLDHTLNDRNFIAPAEPSLAKNTQGIFGRDAASFQADYKSGVINEYADFYRVILPLYHQNPAALKKLFHLNSDDSVTVKLYLSDHREGQEPVSIRITNKLIGIPGTSSPFWVQMLAKALIAAKGMEDPDFRRTGLLDPALLKKIKADELINMLIPQRMEQETAGPAEIKHTVHPDAAMTLDERMSAALESKGTVYVNELLPYEWIEKSQDGKLVICSAANPAAERELPKDSTGSALILGDPVNGAMIREELKKSEIDTVQEKLNLKIKADFTPDSFKEAAEFGIRIVKNRIVKINYALISQGKAGLSSKQIAQLQSLISSKEALKVFETSILTWYKNYLNLQHESVLNEQEIIQKLCSPSSEVYRYILSSCRNFLNKHEKTAAVDKEIKHFAESTMLDYHNSFRDTYNDSTLCKAFGSWIEHDLKSYNEKQEIEKHLSTQTLNEVFSLIKNNSYTAAVSQLASNYMLMHPERTSISLAEELKLTEDSRAVRLGQIDPDKMPLIPALRKLAIQLIFNYQDQNINNPLIFNFIKSYANDRLNNDAEMQFSVTDSAVDTCDKMLIHALNGLDSKETELLTAILRTDSTFRLEMSASVLSVLVHNPQTEFENLNFDSLAIPDSIKAGMLQVLRSCVNRSDKPDDETKKHILDLIDEKLVTLKGERVILNSIEHEKYLAEKGAEKQPEPKASPALSESVMNLSHLKDQNLLYSIAEASVSSPSWNAERSKAAAASGENVNQPQADAQEQDARQQFYWDEDGDQNAYDDPIADAEFEKAQAEKSRIREEENKIILEDASKYDSYGKSDLFHDLLLSNNDKAAADYLYSYGRILSDNYKKIIEPINGSTGFKEYKTIYAENCDVLSKKLGRVAPGSADARLRDLSLEEKKAAGYNIVHAMDDVVNSGKKYAAVLKNTIQTAYKQRGPKGLADDQIRELQAIGKTEFLNELLTAHLHPDHEEALRRRLINTAVLSAAAVDLKEVNKYYHANALKLLTDTEYRSDLTGRLLRNPSIMKAADSVIKSLKISPEEAGDADLSSVIHDILQSEHARLDAQQKREKEAAEQKERFRQHTKAYEELKKTANAARIHPDPGDYLKTEETLSKMGGTPIDLPDHITPDQLTDLMHVYTASLADTLQKLQIVQDDPNAAPDRILPFKNPKEKLNRLYSYLNADNSRNQLIILTAAKNIYLELKAEQAAFASSMDKNQLFTYSQLDQLYFFNELGSPEHVYNVIKNSDNILFASSRAMNLKIIHLMMAEPEAALSSPQLKNALLYPNVFNDLIKNTDPKTKAILERSVRSELNDSRIRQIYGIRTYKSVLQKKVEEIIKADEKKVLKNIFSRTEMTPEKLKSLLLNNIRILKALSPDAFDLNLQKAEIIAEGTDTNKADIVKAAAAVYFDVCGKLVKNLKDKYASVYSDPKQEDYPAIIHIHKLGYTAGLINRGFINLDGKAALKTRLALKLVCTSEMNIIKSGQLSLKDSLLSPDLFGSTEHLDKAVSDLLKGPDYKTLIKDTDEASLSKLLAEDDGKLLEKYESIRNTRLEAENQKKIAAEKLKLEAQRQEQVRLENQKKYEADKLKLLNAEKQKKADADKKEENIAADPNQNRAGQDDVKEIKAPLPEEPKAPVVPEDPKPPVVPENPKPEEKKPSLRKTDPVVKEDADKNIIRTDVKSVNNKNPGMSEKDPDIIDDRDDHIILNHSENRKPDEQTAKKEMSPSSLIEYYNLITRLNNELHTTNHTWTDSKQYGTLKEDLDTINDAAFNPAISLRDAKKNGDLKEIQKYKNILTEKLKTAFETISADCDAYVRVHQPVPPKTYADLKFSETQRERLAIICELKQVCDAYKANTDSTSAAFCKERTAMKLLTGLAVRTLELRIDTANPEYGIKESGVFRHILLDPEFREANMPTNLSGFNRMCEDQLKIYKEKKYPARKHLPEPDPETLERKFFKEFASRDKEDLLKLFNSKKYDLVDQKTQDLKPKHNSQNGPLNTGLLK